MEEGQRGGIQRKGGGGRSGRGKVDMSTDAGILDIETASQFMPNGDLCHIHSCLGVSTVHTA